MGFASANRSKTLTSWPLRARAMAAAWPATPHPMIPILKKSPSLQWRRHARSIMPHPMEAAMAEFALHSRLEADTAFVADWGLSRVLLMNDARYPWLILVPRRPGLCELHHLSDHDTGVLMEEIRRAGRRLKTLTGAQKINTAS